MILLDMSSFHYREPVYTARALLPLPTQPYGKQEPVQGGLTRLALEATGPSVMAADVSRKHYWQTFMLSLN